MHTYYSQTKRTIFQRKQVYLSQTAAQLCSGTRLHGLHKKEFHVYCMCIAQGTTIPFAFLYNQHDCSTDSQINEFENLSGPFSQDCTNTTQNRMRWEDLCVYIYNIKHIYTCNMFLFFFCEIAWFLVPLLLIQTIFCVLFSSPQTKFCTCL